MSITAPPKNNAGSIDFLLNQTDTGTAQLVRGEMQPDDSDLLDAYSRTVVGAVARVAPAVVNIGVAQRVKARNGEREVNGNGSGFVVTRDGFILTNSHVVHEANAISVNLPDGRECAAELTGDDPDTDLAVIRIDAPHLTHVRLADSENLRVGQLGIAIGNPLGFEASVTGWLIKDGKIRRSYIGVGGQNVPIHRRVARFYGLPLETGVLVVSVEKNSPAERAGVREGDLIVAFNGEPIGSVHHLHKILVGEQIGVSASLTIVRHTEKLELPILPAESRAQE